MISGEDARFEDAPVSEQALRLKAESLEDLSVISSLLQDAVGKAGDIAWLPKKRRLVAVVNRFRWENGADGPHERVQSAISIDSVLQVRSRGITPTERDQVYELLAILFEPTEGCGGRLTLTLAGGAEIELQVECLEVALADLSRPWKAQAGKAPNHEV
jgi:hypothetical protein